MAFASAFVQSYTLLCKYNSKQIYYFRVPHQLSTQIPLPTTLNYTEGAASFYQDARDTITDDAFSAKSKVKQQKCIWSTPVTIFQMNLFVMAKVAFSLARKQACIFKSNNI